MNSPEAVRLLRILEAILRELLREVEEELHKHPPVHLHVPDPGQKASLS